ncbi:MAG: hypothetical protein KAT15_04510, partial [Bacteroidales bacterium]|nr:hypothetical protein [Bacteroidales bacterium]
MVGRLDRQSLIIYERISVFQPDIFAPVIYEKGNMNANNGRAAIISAAAGVLVLQKYPDLQPHELKDHLVNSASECWQVMNPETGEWRPYLIEVDPVSGEYSPREEQGESPIFFKRLDVARAMGLEPIPSWPLNALNVQKAWETTTGKGINVAVIDQGFHIHNPEIEDKIVDKAYFGPIGFDGPQNFHGTSMSRILVSVAPDVKLTVLKCSSYNWEVFDDFAENIASAIDYAIQKDVDVISTSWAGFFSEYAVINEKIEEAISEGIVFVWFHYGGSDPDVIRPSFTYFPFGSNIGVFDRYFASDNTYPVEISAGLSNTSPQVAGVAALMLEKDSTFAPYQ